MDEDLWHVRIAPDEVKQLTLEQLDDLFRLEVIEADTLLWQPGMTEWLPLSVVAGLDDEGSATDKVSIPVSAPPPPPRVAQTATAWPPRVASPGPVRQPSTRPAPLPPPPMQRTATVSSWPPPAAWSNPPPKPAAPPAWSNPPPRPPISPYATTVTEPPVRSAPPPSTRPVVISPFASPSPSMAPVPSRPPLSTAPLAQTQRHSRSSGGGGWVVFLAFAAGVAVTLYRNDLVHAAARSVGQEATYFQLERALGGPSFGTPRAVEQMAAAAAALTATSDATAAPAATTASSPSGASAANAGSTTSPSSTTTTTPSAPSTTTTDTAHASDTTHASVTTSATHDAPATVAAVAPSKAAPTKPVAVTHAAPSHAAAPSHGSASSRASSSSPDDVDPVFKTPKKGKKAGKASEYDPLNPSL